MNAFHYLNMDIIIRAGKTTISTAGNTKKTNRCPVLQRQYQSQLRGQRCWHDICLYFANNIILLFITIMMLRGISFFQQVDCITKASSEKKMEKNCTLLSIYILISCFSCSAKYILYMYMWIRISIYTHICMYIFENMLTHLN